MRKRNNSDEIESCSIGDVAQATGISAFTLRMWERRYGAPFSIKRDSGHKRYNIEEITRLRLVKLALDAGNKPSQVVTMTIDELNELLSNETAAFPMRSSSNYLIEKLIDKIKSWDNKSLFKTFEEEWLAHGPIGFVSEFAPKLLTRLGESWSYGEIKVASEHFTSEILESFLEDKWREANDSGRPESYLLSSLEGELHGLGLHMCAAVLTTLKKRVIFLGTSTPAEEIVQAAHGSQCQGVCITISPHYDVKDAEAQIRKIHRQLQPDIAVILGGSGSPAHIPDVLHFSSLKAFYDWIRIGEMK